MAFSLVASAPSHLPRILFAQTVFIQDSEALPLLHDDFAFANLFSRSFLYFSTMARTTCSRFSVVFVRSVDMVFLNSAIYSSQPEASAAHSATARSKSGLDAQVSNLVPHFLFMHVVKVVLHLDLDGLVVAFDTARVICAVTPAALQDCSISLSYVS